MLLGELVYFVLDFLNFFMAFKMKKMIELQNVSQITDVLNIY